MQNRGSNGREGKEKKEVGIGAKRDSYRRWSCGETEELYNFTAVQIEAMDNKGYNNGSIVDLLSTIDDIRGTFGA